MLPYAGSPILSVALQKKVKKTKPPSEKSSSGSLVGNGFVIKASRLVLACAVGDAALLVPDVVGWNGKIDPGSGVTAPLNDWICCYCSSFCSSP
jgi:hypothetical protein